jgi:hypothetical protein
MDNNGKSDGQRSGGFWTTLPGILTGIAGVIGSITALILGLKEVGVFSGPISPPTPSPLTTSINVAYRGDPYSCSFPITIDIGNQSFSPNSNPFQVNNIEIGEQKYQISGNISCPTGPVAGQCQVSGKGLINVVPGKIYYLVWQNTTYAQCSASLQ